MAYISLTNIWLLVSACIAGYSLAPVLANEVHNVAVTNKYALNYILPCWINLN